MQEKFINGKSGNKRKKNVYDTKKRRCNGHLVGWLFQPTFLYL